MSHFTFESFGEVPGCVGSSAISLKQCIIDVHSSNRKDDWVVLQKQGFDFINETHNRGTVMREWSKVIGKSLALGKKRSEVFLSAENKYRQKYFIEAGKDPVKSGFHSFFEHYLYEGKMGGKLYQIPKDIFGSLARDHPPEKDTKCEEGERIYMALYPDVRENWNLSAFSHYLQFGKNEGRIYICRSSFLDTHRNTTHVPQIDANAQQN